MNLLYVHCPSAQWEGDTLIEEDAFDLCYDLSVKYGHARIFDGKCVIADYRNGRNIDSEGHYSGAVK